MSDEYTAWLEEYLGAQVRHLLQAEPSIAAQYYLAFPDGPAPVQSTFTSAVSGDATSAADLEPSTPPGESDLDPALLAELTEPMSDEQAAHIESLFPEELQDPEDAPVDDFVWVTDKQRARLGDARQDWEQWLSSELDQLWGTWRGGDSATLSAQLDETLPLLLLSKDSRDDIETAAEQVVDDVVSAAVEEMTDEEWATLTIEDIEEVLAQFVDEIDSEGSTAETGAR